MRPLWVRLSLHISGLLLAGIVTTAVLGFLLGGPPTPARDTQGEEVPTPSSVLLRLGTVVAFVGIIGTAAGVLVSRGISAPISELAAASRRIGAGELDTRVNVGGSRELHELAHAFNTMADDLRHAEELRANLMADVSHELRTPLTALEGNLRAALDHVYALDEAEIANLYSQTHHLIRLVNDLRELALAEARQLPLDRHPTDLAALVDEALRVFAPLAQEQNISLERRFDTLPDADVDARRVRQVLHNLLGNALRHSSTDGVVSVEGEATDHTITLVISDTGAGLAPDQVGHVFDRFYRGDQSRSRDTGGTGLGLAIVKAIVEAHGGEVAAHSDGLGRGTRVSIHLPRSAA